MEGERPREPHMRNDLMSNSGNIFRWAFLCTLILALILVPFFIFGEKLEGWTDSFLGTAENNSIKTALVIIGLLGSDILLPIPSSIVSTGGGYLLGLTGGFLASFIGLTISCIIGYWLGRKSGRQISSKLLGEKEIGKLEHLNRKFGDWMIVVSRAVPVLAEASVLFAGIGKMKPSRFFLMTALSNAGISIVYAVVGTYSASLNSFLIAFGAAILIPLIAIIILATKARKKSQTFLPLLSFLLILPLCFYAWHYYNPLESRKNSAQNKVGRDVPIAANLNQKEQKNDTRQYPLEKSYQYKDQDGFEHIYLVQAPPLKLISDNTSILIYMHGISSKEEQGMEIFPTLRKHLESPIGDR